MRFILASLIALVAALPLRAEQFHRGDTVLIAGLLCQSEHHVRVYLEAVREDRGAATLLVLTSMANARGEPLCIVLRDPYLAWVTLIAQRSVVEDVPQAPGERGPHYILEVTFGGDRTGFIFATDPLAEPEPEGTAL